MYQRLDWTCDAAEVCFAQCAKQMLTWWRSMSPVQHKAYIETRNGDAMRLLRLATTTFAGVKLIGEAYSKRGSSGIELVIDFRQDAEEGEILQYQSKVYPCTYRHQG